jgi:hypothetical protein
MSLMARPKPDADDGGWKHSWTACQGGNEVLVTRAYRVNRYFCFNLWTSARATRPALQLSHSPL